MVRLTRPHIAPQYALYAVGYALTSVWATVLLFSSLFSAGTSSAIVSASMLTGVVACVGVLVLGPRVPAFDGRSAAASVYATVMAAGTLLCTFPGTAHNPVLRTIGLVVSGFFAILLILTWFEAFSRLPSRTIVCLAGGALLFSALACLAIVSCPVEVASFVMAALPLVSFSLLPRPRGMPASADAATPSLRTVVREAVSWKTLLGVVVAFFVIGAFGELASQLGLQARLHAVTFVIPVAIAAFFVVSAFLAPTRIDASLFYKLLLVGLALLAFMFVYRGATDLSLLFFVYITADVLLWTVLLLTAKRTPVPAHYVFAVGWLAECAGNVLGHNVARLMGGSTELFVLVILLVIVGVGFAFGDGLFVLELEGDEGVAEEPAGPDGHLATDDLTVDAAGRASASASPQLQTLATFTQEHGLSEREAEVFALWVTGHGLKYVENTLFISESTVKTHLRHIYRKCGVHNRAQLIELFECS